MYIYIYLFVYVFMLMEPPGPLQARRSSAAATSWAGRRLQVLNRITEKIYYDYYYDQRIAIENSYYRITTMKNSYWE